MKSAWIVLALLLGVIAETDSRAESMSKHPRVAELEDSLRTQASGYLRSRFPDQPFLVSISVDPVRRNNTKVAAEMNGDNLPYFDADENELNDEWDDPSISLHQLQLRTAKIVVDVSLSENVSDGERAEVRDSLYQSLHLIQARDEIKVETKKWTSVRTYTYYFVTGLALLLFFLIGFAVVQRYGYKRIAQALSQIQITNAPGSGGGPIGVSTPTSSHEKEGASGNAGLEFSDPVKLREFMAKMIELSEKSDVFPTLNTMVHLDRLGKKSPGALGALLQELPANMQKKIFAYGRDNYWFEAMLQPGHFGMEEVECFQRLVREAAFGHEVHVEEMLIRVWRLGSDLENFVRSLDREVALAILSLFPKDKAIQYARKAFPGAWANLLDSEYRPAKLTAAICKDIAERAEKAKALLDFSKLTHYRQLSELLAFLETATPDEEKEIYLISKSTSMIHQTRPPFYPVLEAAEDDLKAFVSMFNPQQWTLALFNVDRGKRRAVQNVMQDKQKFMFVELLKQLDQNHPDPHQVGKMREQIARKFIEYKQNQEKLEDTLKAVAEGEAAIDKDDDQAA